MVTNRQIVLCLSAAISLIFLWQAPKAWSNLSAIKSRQIAANDRLVDWKQAYQALLPINAKWDGAFSTEAEASDLLKLYRIANIEQHGLRADVDQVRQVASEPLSVNGMDVGVAKICIATLGDTMQLTAPNMTSLRTGLISLSKRRDISMGSIEVGMDSETGLAIGKLKPFCVLVRTGGQDNSGVQ